MTKVGSLAFTIIRKLTVGLTAVIISVLTKLTKYRKTVRLEKKILREERKIAKNTQKNSQELRKTIAQSQAQRDKALLKAQKIKNEQTLRLVQEKTAVIKNGKIFNPRRIRRYLSVTQLLAPILIPAIYRLSTKLQTAYNEKRAQESGIPLIDLGKYSGTGGKLASRIEAARVSLLRIQKTNSANLEIKNFVSINTKKLEDLANAVNSAERLPRGRKNIAQLAIDEQLSIIENDLLIQLGVFSS